MLTCGDEEEPHEPERRHSDLLAAVSSHFLLSTSCRLQRLEKARIDCWGSL